MPTIGEVVVARCSASHVEGALSEIAHLTAASMPPGSFSRLAAAREDRLAPRHCALRRSSR